MAGLELTLAMTSNPRSDPVRLGEAPADPRDQCVGLGAATLVNQARTASRRLSVRSA